jgi:hypothetical protein
MATKQKTARPTVREQLENCQHANHFLRDELRQAEIQRDEARGRLDQLTPSILRPGIWFEEHVIVEKPLVTEEFVFGTTYEGSRVGPLSIVYFVSDPLRRDKF